MHFEFSAFLPRSRRSGPSRAENAGPSAVGVSITILVFTYQESDFNYRKVFSVA